MVHTGQHHYATAAVSVERILLPWQPVRQKEEEDDEIR